jgi:predicted alpha/beta hydrolase family esterase
MKKLEISTEDLLKNWYYEDLWEALKSARRSANEAWGTPEYAMWVKRANAYGAELTRRDKSALK